jgi:acetyl-CoA carboxylase biotin carboxyl carrier protein
MTDLGFELEEIARLIKLVEQRGLSELIVEEEGRRIVIRGAGYKPTQSMRMIAPSPDAVATESQSHDPQLQIPAPVAAPAAPIENRIALSSPTVGVFYRAAGPDTAPYVEVGDRVEEGQTIGMLEAMKVFSEIPAEHAGIVAEVVAHNGQLVKTNEPLLYLLAE